MTRKQLSMLGIALLGLLAFLQYHLWFEAGGISDMLKLKKALALQAQQNDSLKKRNEAIMFQVERLHGSADATEARARNELGMIKKGELFYQIVK